MEERVVLICEITNAALVKVSFGEHSGGKFFTSAILTELLPFYLSVKKIPRNSISLHICSLMHK